MHMTTRMHRSRKEHAASSTCVFFMFLYTYMIVVKVTRPVRFTCAAMSTSWGSFRYLPSPSFRKSSKLPVDDITTVGIKFRQSSDKVQTKADRICGITHSQTTQIMQTTITRTFFGIKRSWLKQQNTRLQDLAHSVDYIPGDCLLIPPVWFLFVILPFQSWNLCVKLVLFRTIRDIRLFHPFDKCKPSAKCAKG